jgi:hypothetical protein
MPHRLRARFLALALLTALAGCGGAQARAPDPGRLLQGAKSPISLANRDAATAVATRFAAAYAKSVYDPTPPLLPTASAEVNRAIRSAAARIPPPRVGRHAGAGVLRLTPESSVRFHAAATIDDGRSLPFSVGFTLRRLSHGWRVTAISPPG